MAAQKGRAFLLKLVTTGTGILFTTDVDNDTIDATSHGLSDDDVILFAEGAAPGGLSEGRHYYVVNSTVNDLQVAETQGGSALTITAAAPAATVIKPVTAVETVAGCRTNGLSINNQTVDVTTKDDEGWRRLLDGVAFKNMSLTAAGIFQSAGGKAAVITRILNGTIDHYQVVFGFGDRFEGAFQMASLGDNGPHDNVEEFDFTLESSGGVA